MDETTRDGCAGCGGVSRRVFVGQSTLIAASAVLAACGGPIPGLKNPLGSGSGASTTIHLADYPALAGVGGIARVSTATGAIAVVRQAAGTFVAFSMACPHQGTTVGIQGGAFVCPNHGARFSSTGQWTGGQQTSNLASVAVTYDAAAGTLTLGAVGGTTGNGGDDDGDD